jgi:peptide/nickel transport system substrate-binding protein
MRRVVATFVAVAGILAPGVGAAYSHAAAAHAPARAAKTAALLVVGCSAVSNLNPAKQTAGCSNILHNIGLENLMRLGPNGSPKPNLAQSVKQTNATTYIYTLRKGVKFWDGTEMTSADVVNAMTYYATPGNQTANYYKTVRSITAKGRYTVVVKLKQPDASWPTTTAGIAQIFEKKFFDQHKDTMGQPAALPIGTGAWKFDSLDPSTGAELSAFNQYWGGKPLIKHISFKFFSDETSEALAFRAHQIDIGWPTGGAAFASTSAVKIGGAAIGTASGSKVIGVSGCGIGMISMNTQLAPWSDVHVRRAVAYATDRASMAKALGGDVAPLTQMIPPPMMETIASKAAVTKLYKSLPSYPFNITKAKQELAQSADPHGFSASINSTTAVGGLDLTDQILAADLKKIGIDLQVNDVPIGQWVAQFYGPRSGLPIFGSGSGCPAPDPSWYPGVFFSSANAITGGTNIANYAKPAVDKLISAAIATNNRAKRFADYSKLLKIAANDVPYVAQYVRKSYVAVSSKFIWPHFFSFASGDSWPLFVKPS